MSPELALQSEGTGGFFSCLSSRVLRRGVAEAGGLGAHQARGGPVTCGGRGCRAEGQPQPVKVLPRPAGEGHPLLRVCEGKALWEGQEMVGLEPPGPLSPPAEERQPGPPSPALSESPCSLMPTEEPIRLLREVVLLTDDRNLRVKALTRNVPVRDIPAFLMWAQVG